MPARGGRSGQIQQQDAGGDQGGGQHAQAAEALTEQDGADGGGNHHAGLPQGGDGGERRGLSSNRTANGDSEPGRAELPPFTAPMWVVSVRGESCNGSVALGRFLAGGLGIAELGAEELVPPRRLAELAKYGMSADASQIRRHPDGRRLATLLATVRFLEAKSVDDTLELLDLLMATELLNKAQTAANKEMVRKHPKLAKASARLAVAVAALFDADGWGGPEEEPRVSAVWEAIELGLPDKPDALLAEHAATLDAAYRQVGGRLAVNTEVRVDDAGKIHLTGVKAVEEPPSLVDLRNRTTAMLPRVDLPEVILEVMSWEPELAAAFTAASGGRSRLEDLDTSIAACLAAHSMNVGYRPIAKNGVPALERSRLSHVFQNYFRPETLAPANAPLVARQAGLPLAQAWGGGMVAAVDGMRFIVPVPAAFARPNRKFFGSKRGMTWLNAMNDQGIGRGAKVVSGTVRDSLHTVDVIFGLDGGDLPEIVVTDTGSYSDVVFGLLELLGISYRPALADLPDQKGWRINADADYGALNTFARGKIDLRKVRRNWDDILRVVASVYTGTVRAYDVVTMLQRDGHPTALGEAIAAYGRIFKSLHILNYIDVDETYYLDAAVRRLKAQGYPVRDEDMARLSPFVNTHLGVHGTYSFVLPDLAPGAIRELRDPDAADEGDE